MSKIIYYHVKSFQDVWDAAEIKLARSFGLHSPRFRVGFKNYLDVVENPLPNILLKSTDVFDDLIIRRAAELWSIGKPIRLWWSGGIDSTCALVGLLQTKRLGDDLTVYLSIDSVKENPKFYDKLVGSRINIQWHSHADYVYDNIELWNGDSINVNGNGGDELFIAVSSSMSMESFFKIKDKHWSNLDVDKDTVEKYIDVSPYKPETCWELLWWFARSIDDLSTRYHSPRFLKDPSVYHLEYPFFYTDYFEQWALSNLYAGHNGEYKTLKWPMKKFIYEWDNNKEYFENKEKESSFPSVYSNNFYPALVNKVVYENGTYERKN